jgi:hypothetical protein
MVIRNITRLARGTTTTITRGNITELVTGTMGFTDTIIIIRGTVIPITDLTINHIITVMVTTLTLGFTSLPTEPGSISDSAFDAAQAVRMMVATGFSFCRQEVKYGSLRLWFLQEQGGASVPLLFPPDPVCNFLGIGKVGDYKLSISLLQLLQWVGASGHGD